MIDEDHSRHLDRNGSCCFAQAAQRMPETAFVAEHAADTGR
ncbi:hypothetical protein [Mesorhizobium sp. M2A.F.Ca.ET.017.03.2.1]|nr:hypothetical protein [Mesorhizobium sp. M2A.F.Ca.ET.017.03.2.1]